MADKPRITVRCEYPNMGMPPTEVTGLAPSYSTHNALEAL